ncbi:PREDICTED: zinc finger protein 425-like [Wasmannia auropunctata]|uniref:zinc finger protein 425-like n=1 Tax=Wasmannia auropunctata TaxID=64793 RepID=UPI0005EE970E|nr:PREDICTED: zinc finger protein 425-like [Wasmannia auropunctata]
MSVNPGCINFKPYGCGMCDLRFSNPIKLDDHLFVNHDSQVTAPKCSNHCTKIFTSEKSLRSHVLAEHKRQHCRCSFCSASYENFRRYSKTFNNGCHMCPYCRKSFIRWKELNVHMSIHEKPMRCKICGKKFRTKQLMRQHLIDEHPEEDYQWLSSHVSTGPKIQGATKIIKLESAH